MRRAKAHQSLHPGDLSPVAPPPMPSPVHSKQDDESAARGHDVSVGADSGADAPTEQEMKRQSVDAFNAGLRCFKAKEWGAAASHFTIAIDSKHPRLGMALAPSSCLPPVSLTAPSYISLYRILSVHRCLLQPTWRVTCSAWGLSRSIPGPRSLCGAHARPR